MKMIVENNEAEGLESLLGEKVLLMCVCYFYTGKLVGVNSSCVKLEDPAIVYDTGDWSDEGYSDAQRMSTKYHYVSTDMIESFGGGK